MGEHKVAKTVVTVMTIILIGMCGLLLWGLANKVGKTGALSGNTVSSAPVQPWVGTLPAGKIRGVSSSGDTALIWLESRNGTAVYVYNLRESRLVGTLNEAPEAP